jgi:hypothetical protein
VFLAALRKEKAEAQPLFSGKGLPLLASSLFHDALKLEVVLRISVGIGMLLISNVLITSRGIIIGIPLVLALLIELLERVRHNIQRHFATSVISMHGCHLLSRKIVPVKACCISCVLSWGESRKKATVFL